MKYKIPVTLLVETEDDGGTNRIMSDVEVTKLKAVVSESLDYLLSDMDFLYDSIQERLPGDLCLTSLHVEKENEKMYSATFTKRSSRLNNRQDER